MTCNTPLLADIQFTTLLGLNTFRRRTSGKRRNATGIKSGRYSESSIGSSPRAYQIKSIKSLP